MEINPYICFERSSVSKTTFCLIVGVFFYIVFAKLGMSVFTLSPSNISLLWLPVGIGTIMCLTSGLIALPFIFLASYFVNFAGMQQDSASLHYLHTGIAAAADTLGPWLAFLMARKFLPDGLNRYKCIFPFLLFVCLLPTLASAVILSANLEAGGYISHSDFYAMISKLVFADSLGILLIYPLFSELKSKLVLPQKTITVWASVTAGSLLLIYLSFNTLPGLIYWVIPCLIYLAFRTPPVSVFLALILVIFTTIGFAGINPGAFGAGAQSQNLFLLQSYLFTTSFIIVGIVLLQKDLVQALQSGQHWQRRAGLDALTGLINRYALMPLIDEAIARATRHQSRFCLAMLDIDHFKKINDTLGHTEGDRVLKSTASVLQQELRITDKLARYGGEEFVLLLPDTELDEAYAVLERMRGALQKERISHPSLPTITFSAGLVQWSAEVTPTRDALLSAADQLMYQAKKAGRNTITK